MRSGSPPLLRVLHVIGPMEIGGAQNQLLGLLRAAHGLHWDATVCATEGGPMLGRFRELDLPVTELIRRGSPGLGRLAAVRRLVGRGEFDVIHAVLPHNAVYGRIAAMLRRRRPAVVVAERDVEPRSAAVRVADRLLSPWVDAWIANSSAVATRVRALPGGSSRPVTTISNAVDELVFPPLPPPPPGPPWVVGTVARLSAEKGIGVILDAACILRERSVPVRIALAGEGPMREEAASRARYLPVELVGPVAPGSGVRDLLARCHLFVLPSLREGSPNALLEAASCGVPSIATAIPAVIELGLDLAATVAPGDPEALADAIEATIDDLAAESRPPRAARRGVLGFGEQALRYRTTFESVAAARR